MFQQNLQGTIPAMFEFLHPSEIRVFFAKQLIPVLTGTHRDLEIAPVFSLAALLLCITQGLRKYVTVDALVVRL
jgi:hypothetical protein